MLLLHQFVLIWFDFLKFRMDLGKLIIATGAFVGGVIIATGVTVGSTVWGGSVLKGQWSQKIYGEDEDIDDRCHSILIRKTVIAPFIKGMVCGIYATPTMCSGKDLLDTDPDSYLGPENNTANGLN